MYNRNKNLILNLNLYKVTASRNQRNINELKLREGTNKKDPSV